MPGPSTGSTTHRPPFLPGVLLSELTDFPRKDSPLALLNGDFVTSLSPRFFGVTIFLVARLVFAPCRAPLKALDELPGVEPLLEPLGAALLLFLYMSHSEIDSSTSERIISFDFYQPVSISPEAQIFEHAHRLASLPFLRRLSLRCANSHFPDHSLL